jgi:hypothetical protein
MTRRAVACAAISAFALLACGKEKSAPDLTAPRIANPVNAGWGLVTPSACASPSR